jgi:Ca2+-binding RTX toxin-like protein
MARRQKYPRPSSRGAAAQNPDPREAAVSLTGTAPDDDLIGTGFNDTIAGGDGSDQLAGGRGGNRSTGGGGADRLIFETAADSGSIRASRDRIKDFSQAGGDRMDLSAIDAGSADGDRAFAFIATAAFSGTEGEMRNRQTATKTIVKADIDGDGVAEFGIVPNAILTMTSGDFGL